MCGTGPARSCHPSGTAISLRCFEFLQTKAGAVTLEAERPCAPRCGHELLLQDYLPVVIFIGVSLVIGLALLISPFIVAYQNPIPRSCRLTNAASMRSTTPA